MSGDIASNTLSSLTNYTIGDSVYVYTATNTPAYQKYSTASGIFGGHGYNGNWTIAGDPILGFVGEGFWYDATAPLSWVEDYSVSQ
jgi:hypothetical protein